MIAVAIDRKWPPCPLKFCDEGKRRRGHSISVYSPGVRWVGWLCGRGAQSEEGSDSGAGASWLASGSAVAGEGGGEGGEGGEAGCSWP